MINKLYSLCMAGTELHTGAFARHYVKIPPVREAAGLMQALEMTSDDPIVRCFRASQFVSLVRTDSVAFQKVLKADPENTYKAILPYVRMTTAVTDNGSILEHTSTDLLYTYLPHGLYRLLYREGILMVTGRAGQTVSYQVPPGGWVVFDNSIKLNIPASWGDFGTLDFEYTLTPNAWGYDIDRILNALSGAPADVLDDVDTGMVNSVCGAAANYLLRLAE